MCRFIGLRWCGSQWRTCPRTLTSTSRTPLLRALPLGPALPVRLLVLVVLVVMLPNSGVISPFLCLSFVISLIKLTSFPFCLLSGGHPRAWCCVDIVD